MGRNYKNSVEFDLDCLFKDIKELREQVKNYPEENLEYTKANLKELEECLMELEPMRLVMFLKECQSGKKNIAVKPEVIAHRIEALYRYMIALDKRPKDQPIEVYVSQIVDGYPDSIYPPKNKQTSKDSTDESYKKEELEDKQTSKDSTDKIYKKEELEKISAEELDKILTNRMNDNSNKEKELSDLEQKKELIQKILEEQKRGAELDKQISEKTSEISAMIKGE